MKHERMRERERVGGTETQREGEQNPTPFMKDIKNKPWYIGPPLPLPPPPPPPPQSNPVSSFVRFVTQISEMAKHVLTEETCI